MPDAPSRPPAPFGSTFVPAAAAFLTCFVIGVGLSLLFGVDVRMAIPAGFTVSAIVAAYAVMSGRRRRGCD